MRTLIVALAVATVVVASGVAAFQAYPVVYSEMSAYTTATVPFFNSSVPAGRVQYLYPPVNGSLLEVFQPPSVAFNGTAMNITLRFLPVQCLRFNESCGSFPFFVGNMTVSESDAQLHVGKLVQLNQTVDLSLRFGRPVPPGTPLVLSIAVFSSYRWCDTDQVCQYRLGAGKTLTLNLGPYLNRPGG